MATHRVLHPLKRFLLRSTGYSYPNMGRLFLRLFIGIMLMQFGLDQIADFQICKDTFPSVFGMGSQCSLVVMIIIEIICSLFIMAGLLTRVISVPPFIAMAIAEAALLSGSTASVNAVIKPWPWLETGVIPVMFMGIYFFLFLVGPGKISIDYMLSLRIINSEDCNEDDELEIM